MGPNALPLPLPLRGGRVLLAARVVDLGFGEIGDLQFDGDEGDLHPSTLVFTQSRSGPYVVIGHRDDDEEEDYESVILGDDATMITADQNLRFIVLFTGNNYFRAQFATDAGFFSFIFCFSEVVIQRVELPDAVRRHQDIVRQDIVHQEIDLLDRALVQACNIREVVQGLPRHRLRKMHRDAHSVGIVLRTRNQFSCSIRSLVSRGGFALASLAVGIACGYVTGKM